MELSLQVPHGSEAPSSVPIRFIVDAQLPRRLAYALRDAGYDALHTLDLTAANRTADESINALSLRESRVVISKDSDFRDSLLLYGRPYKLLLVSTGNCANAALLDLITQHLPTIVRMFQQAAFLELTWDGLIIRQ